MKFVSKVLACMLALCVLTVTVAPAFAAVETTCKNIGGSKNTVTFIVKTDNKWFAGSYIKFKQTKGEYTSTNVFTGKKKKEKSYGEYEITAESTDGKHTVEKDMTGSSFKLKLKKNKTYVVTVKFKGAASNSIFAKLRPTIKVWNKHPSWEISKTGGRVYNCSFR